MFNSQISSDTKTTTWPPHQPNEEVNETSQGTQITGSPERHVDSQAPSTPNFKQPPSSVESPTAPYKRAYTHIRPQMNTTPEAQHTVKVAWSLRYSAPQAIILEPTENASKKRRITPSAIYVDEESAGRGAQSTAVFSKKVSTKPDGTPEKRVVIKEGTESLRQEKKLFDRQFPNAEDARHINAPKEALVIPQTGQWMAEYEACRSDLAKVSYDREDPATYAVRLLLGFVEGLEALHSHGVIHRDIKAGNLLVDEKEEGAIGDLGLMILIPKKGETHRTTLTPTYAAPFIWENILGQKTREGGHQDEAADVYALGCVISRDILKSMIVQLFKKHDLDPKSYLEAVKPKILEGKYTDEALLEIEAKHNGQVVYFDMRTKERIYLFPPRKEVYKATTSAISELSTKENCPSKKELRLMKSLAVLAHNYQSKVRSELTVEKLKNDLEKITSS